MRTKIADREKALRSQVDDMRLCQECVPLGPWLYLAQAAGVPFVEADFSPEFPVTEMMAALDNEPCPRFEIARQWAIDEKLRRIGDGEKVTMRYECCSTSMVKQLAAAGVDWTEGYTDICVDDPRVINCTVGVNTRICVRPWVPCLRVLGYPVEFRIYYGPDGYMGTSNYYPQRDLPNSGWISGAAHLAEHYAARIFAAGKFPSGCTMDFIAAENGDVLLLEGGPPHCKGPVSAHPCCFPPFEIRGRALAAMPGSLKA